MSNATQSSQSANSAPDTVLVEKVRWSLRQRFRKHWHMLSTEFFDEVDDFLFASGRSGQISADGSYLKSMRELRAKQAVFEEKFLERAIDLVKQASRDERAIVDNAQAMAQANTSAYETVETDLALQAMMRKAERLYQPHARQIANLQKQIDSTGQVRLVVPETLLQAVSVGFAEAQSVFTIPLDTRLLIIKLFEQHFMLKLEKLYLDTISIIQNINDPAFVEKLYSSASAFRVQAADPDKTIIQSNSIAPVVKSEEDRKSAQIETVVEQLVASICDDKELPAFLDTMIRQQWREVIFLIGLHRGTTSVEWGEAKHSISLLATAVAEKIYLQTADYDSIKEHLRQGFAMIQLGWREQERFFQELADYFQAFAPHDEKREISTIERLQKSGLEASITRAGEELLDQEDLDEIAKLLGGDDTDEGKQLEDYLQDVDALEDQVMVDFMLNGVYVQCLLTRSYTNPGQYTISKRGSKVSVTRSRLGLGIALQSGELRMPRQQVIRSAGSRTVLQTSSQTRH